MHKLPADPQMSMFPTDSEVDFWRRLNAGERLDCPCCKRYAQIYRRKLHTGMALQLIQLYRIGGADRFVHVKEMHQHFSGTGDLTKFKYWDGMIPGAKAEDDTDHKTAGTWKLTAKGVKFILGKILLPEYALVFDDRVLGFSDSSIDIEYALGDKFSYEELMRGKA